MKIELISALLLPSIFLSGAGAWFIGKYGYRLNLLDEPNERSSHRIATPRGGAIGILAAFVFASFCLNIPPSFWAPAALLAGVSFIGDQIEISPIVRLIFQFVASIILLFGYWTDAPESAPNLVMIIPFAIYIAATVNYYNFMDGINGIAGITGTVGFFLLAVFSYSRHIDINLTLLSINLSFSCLGFLPFNVPRARVFMGDVGSILLGFVFAAMVIWLSKSLLDFLCLASFLFPFYADELTTELVRLRDGEKIWKPHRRHLYQLLANEYGIRHWKIAAGYGIAQLLIGVSIFFMINAGICAVAITICFYLMVFSIFSCTIRKRLVQSYDV
jgi:Fuc2NAc and GlcNAc transferase